MDVALVPARGGSKRIPRKNLRDFHGKPIIAYSIEVALQSGLFDDVIVSTDDDEIAEVAKSLGASVPFIRPADLSDDYATTQQVINHCLNWYHGHDKSIAAICCIYATAPFVRSSDLKLGRKAIVDEGFEFSFSATDFAFPVQRAFRVLDSGGVDMLHPENLNTRSQDLEPVYHDAGQFYWGRPAAFLKGKAIFSEFAKPILIPRYRAQDIDTLEDWMIAEQMYLHHIELDGQL